LRIGALERLNAVGEHPLVRVRFLTLSESLLLAASPPRNMASMLAGYTNASLADYYVPVDADIPDMSVKFIDEHDAYINALSVKGNGYRGRGRRK
jgi:hypothetical protein